MSAGSGTDTASRVEERLLVLTAEERAVLAKRRFSGWDRAVVAHLLDPFERALRMFVLEEWRTNSPRYVKWACEVANHRLARMMVAMDRTYWAFDWDGLLTWREGVLEQNEGRSQDWHREWDKWWRRVTQSLFFLGAIPYHEAMCPSSNRRLARRWIGAKEAQNIEDRFLATAKRIGYWNERQMKKTVVGVLFGAMLFAGKKDAATLTKEDLENWQAWSDRSQRVVRESVTRVQKVLSAMGHLENEPPRRSGMGLGQLDLPSRATKPVTMTAAASAPSSKGVKTRFKGVPIRAPRKTSIGVTSRATWIEEPKEIAIEKSILFL